MKKHYEAQFLNNLILKDEVKKSKKIKLFESKIETNN
jgi:hypothetical protein